MEVMTNKGYGNLTKIYTYKSIAESKLNSDNIRNQITWIAQYNHFCTYSGSYVGGSILVLRAFPVYQEILM